MNSLVRLESIPKLWTISELLLVLQLTAQQQATSEVTVLNA